MDNIGDLGEPLQRGGLLDSISRFIGEKPEATQSAFNAALPTSMYAIADYGTTEAGARSLFEGLRDRKLPELDAKNLGSALGDTGSLDRLMTSSGVFFERLLGGKLSGLVQALSHETGIGKSGASKLFAFAAPLALGLIGRKAREDKLDAAGLAGFLRQQKAYVAKMVPGRLGSLLGIAPVAPAPVARVEPIPSPPRARAVEPAALELEKPRRSWWTWALVGLAALAAIGLLIGRNRTRVATEVKRPVVTAPQPPPVKLPTVPVPAVPAPAPEPAMPATFADELRAYMSGADTSPKRFVLEGHDFDTAEASPDSHQAADTLADALVAYPGVKVRIEGHTDTVGDVTANQALSLERAERLKSYLGSKGVDANRIETEGKGQTDPRASNDTEEGRAANRRIELVLMK